MSIISAPTRRGRSRPAITRAASASGNWRSSPTCSRRRRPTNWWSRRCTFRCATYLDPHDPATNTADRADFLKLLADRPDTLSLSGHTHTTEHHYFGAEDGFAGPAPHHHHVLTAVSGSWWSGPYDHRGIAVADSRDGSPNGFHVLSIDGNRAIRRASSRPTSRMPGRCASCSTAIFHGDRKELYNDYRMGQLLGSPLPQARVSATDLIVNVFDGGPRTSVEYRIGEPRAGADGTRAAARSVRRGGVRPQRGDQEAVGEGRAFIAHLGRRDCRPISRPAPIASLCG